ncbi:hypothetical protein [Nostoc sp.]|uniref:hypothetical protein n=1 Tax=Nostoc sp. TaxID=1180 RepID=UPI002FF6D437
MLTTVITPHPQPLPALREGRQMGFFGLNKQSSGHDMSQKGRITINVCRPSMRRWLAYGADIKLLEFTAIAYRLFRKIAFFNDSID